MVKKKKTISEVEKPKTFTKKYHQSKKPKSIKKTEPIVQPPRPIVQEKPKKEPVLEVKKPEVKKEPVLEVKKPEVKIDSEISNEIKSFFLGNKPKKIIKENKIIKKEEVEESIAKEAENFFKSN